MYSGIHIPDGEIDMDKWADAAMWMPRARINGIRKELFNRLDRSVWHIRPRPNFYRNGWHLTSRERITNERALLIDPVEQGAQWREISISGNTQSADSNVVINSDQLAAPAHDRGDRFGGLSRRQGNLFRAPIAESADEHEEEEDEKNAINQWY